MTNGSVGGGGVRVGVDVGGTFTKAVAVDSLTGELVARSVVATTHTATEGVAAGVVECVRAVADVVGAERVELVTHSTTQAVNALLEVLREDRALLVGENEPYAASDATDYALVVHGERRGLLHVEIEMRQDLIEHAPGQDAWAARLAGVLPRALEMARLS